MRKIAALAVCMVLASCAVCNHHPKTCTAVAIGVSAAVIVGLGARDWNRCSVIGQDTRVPSCARH